MKLKNSLNLVLISTLLMTACSFQKDPNKVAPPTPEPVKIGMTKEELQEEILKSVDMAFPDKLLLAGKKGDKELVLKLLKEANSNDLNEYGVGGFTAMELLIKTGDDGLLVDALSKGGSLFKFRKGTKYRIYSVLDNSGVGSFELSRAAMSVSNERMRKDSFNALISPSIFLSHYWRTHYPVLQAIEGKTLLENITKFKSNYIDISLKYEQTHTWAPLLKLIEETEGPITSGVFELLLFFVEIRDPYSVQYLKDRMGSISSEQRQEILQRVTFPTIEWLLGLKNIFSLTQDELRFLEVKTVKELGPLEAKTLKAIRASFSRWDINGYAAESLPNLHSFLTEKFKDIDGRVDDRAGGISNIDIYGFRTFPHGNLYEALMDDDTSKYQKCLNWYDTF